ncbi:hypothetical protein B0T17DRAFT_635961 [Bombardia bombarda]|uniref:Swi5-dependent recombination DNA repair protein 1 n=1 Tax=Bombardia bombarda TaxID=252184 RepID=A0AA39XBF4_9PEZI|nr:hypothetical protein B0T17DRAFT_635961 [Bombardia bombarda]
MTSQTPGPPVKRRRLDQANATLRKPFRSPMISRPKPADNRGGDGGDGGDGDDAGAEGGAAPTTTHRATPGPEILSISDATPMTSGGTTTTTQQSWQRRREQDASATPTRGTGTATALGMTPFRLTPGGPSSASRLPPVRRPRFARPAAVASSPNPCPTSSVAVHDKQEESKSLGKSLNVVSKEGSGGGYCTEEVEENDEEEEEDLLEQMRKTQRETSVHLRAMQQELDVIRQAGRIERQTLARGGGEVDAELKEVTERWRLACRQAAEDVFELIKGRVENMGGAKAWRETRKRQHEFFRGFDEDGGGGGSLEATGREGEDDGLQEEREGFGGGEDDRGEYGEGNDGDCEGDGEDGREAEEDGEESDFTMLMMLKSLNIDPDILGYDPVEDKWRE